MLARLSFEHVVTLQLEVLIWIALAAIPVAAVGWIVGIFFVWPTLLGPIAARLQGWPFSVGDRVWILRGRHKGTVTDVYEVWSERGQVRVELGHEARDKVEDVYCAVQVCRV